MGCIALASLTPFTFDVPAAGAGEWFGLTRVGWASPTAEDVLVNVVVYVPLGALLAVVGRVQWKRRRCVLLATVVGAAVSFGLEWLQTLSSVRCASWLDVCLNGLGAFLGAAAASLAGPWVGWFWGRYRPGREPTLPGLSLGAMTIALVLISLFPFDFATDTATLWRSLGQARLTFDAGRYDPSGNAFATWIARIGPAFWFAVLGFLGVMSRGRRVRSADQDEKPVFRLVRTADPTHSSYRAALRSLGHVALVASLIEVLQIFVASHTCDIGDWLAGVLAGAIGAAVAGWCRSSEGGRITRWVLGSMLMGQVAYLLAVNALPFDFSWGAVDLSRMSLAPFAAYVARPFGSAIGQLAEVVGAYLMLAWLLRAVLAVRGVARSVAALSVVTVAFAVAAASQVLQLLTLSRHADVTDPLVAVCVAVAAALWPGDRTLARLLSMVALPTAALDPGSQTPLD